MSELQNVAIESYKRFLASVAVPILYDDPSNKLDHLGTGTLFELDDMHFLVTARHVLEGKELPRLLLPEQPGGKPITLGDFEVVTPQDPPCMDLDLTILRLKHPEAIKTLTAGWRFLRRTNVAAPTHNGHFLLCGYPRVFVVPDDNGRKLSMKLVNLVTKRISATPHDAKQPVQENLDIFLSHDDGAYDLNDTTIGKLDLQGMSGSSVWEITERLSDENFWNPSDDLKVVAIQVAQHEGYARAKNWAMVDRLFHAAYVANR